jgi:hypothetical protein
MNLINVLFITSISLIKGKNFGAGGKNSNFFGKRFEFKTNNKERLLAKGFIKTMFDKKTNVFDKKTHDKNLNVFDKNVNVFDKKTLDKKIFDKKIFDKNINVFDKKIFDKNVKVFDKKKSNVFDTCSYLSNINILENRSIVFVLQTGFKKYMKHKYNIELFRFPDEAYIIKDKLHNKTIVKILEKKEQHVDGSVETKLWSGPSLKREYELVLGPGFEVHYGFCVSAFLKQKLESDIPKYMILRQIWRENHIEVLFGDDEDYFEKLDEWING